MTAMLLRKLASLFRVPIVTHTLRWTWRIAPILIMMDVGYLIGVWPDWELYSDGPIQRSSFIRSYEFEQHRHSAWPKLRWSVIVTVPFALLLAGLVSASVDASATV